MGGTESERGTMKSWWKKFLNAITFGMFYCKIFGHTKSNNPDDYVIHLNYYKSGFCAKCGEMFLVGWCESEGFVPVEDVDYYKSAWKKED